MVCFATDVIHGRVIYLLNNVDPLNWSQVLEHNTNVTLVLVVIFFIAIIINITFICKSCSYFLLM